jgi:hypothetical protein
MSLKSLAELRYIYRRQPKYSVCVCFERTMDHHRHEHTATPSYPVTFFFFKEKGKRQKFCRQEMTTTRVFVMTTIQTLANRCEYI